MSVTRDDSAGQGEQDRQRYQQKIRDQIRKAIPAAIDHVPIISGDGAQSVGIPLPEGGLGLPRFTPHRPENPEDGVGQGPGKAGDVVGIIPAPGEGQDGTEAGDQHQDHVIDLTLEEVRAMMLEDLELPPLSPKRPPILRTPQIRWNTVSRHGSLTGVDAKASLKEAIARSQAQGAALTFHPDDLRYRSWTEKARPKTSAVVYLLRDISGSMTPYKAYLARAVATYVVVWMQSVYEQCPLSFWVHDTEAAEVEEEAFFHAADGGGTLVGPAYQAVQAHMDVHYPEAAWNRILLHFSDGDVFDGQAAYDAASQVLPSLVLFGLVLTKARQITYGESSGLRRALRELPPPYRAVELAERAQVVQATRDLLREETTHAAR